eukprot:jgi/Bigna1/144784/aug1.91_g19492
MIVRQPAKDQDTSTDGTITPRSALSEGKESIINFRRRLVAAKTSRKKLPWLPKDSDWRKFLFRIFDDAGSSWVDMKDQY